MSIRVDYHIDTVCVKIQIFSLIYSSRFDEHEYNNFSNSIVIITIFHRRTLQTRNRAQTVYRAIIPLFVARRHIIIIVYGIFYCELHNRRRAYQLKKIRILLFGNYNYTVRVAVANTLKLARGHFIHLCLKIPKSIKLQFSPD